MWGVHFWVHEFERVDCGLSGRGWASAAGVMRSWWVGGWVGTAAACPIGSLSVSILI